ncbi:restriction endonuclease subunit S [Desulfovibrio desulfuricans]|uniref:restriction endonuclease subunit S n=1 Tax=Desulfovibrio desulfuricans TaxID=876 RepID=UPI001F46EC16|nr:restriction endonuclease subunit S [Desulfovibrio desulfuricans]UIA98814.1 restriction endonuclease subunit S [Desulfovibrio desulfuricans]
MSESNLPNGWTQAAVIQLCILTNGAVFKTSDWEINGLPIIRIQNLNNPLAQFNHSAKVLPEKYKVHAGDLLFAWSGTPGTSFGAHIWNGPTGWLNQHIFRVSFNEDLVDKIFFRIALNHRLDDIIDRAHGGVGLRHITKEKFEATILPIPPLNEQHRIAAKIEALQAHSTKAKKALEEAQRLLEKFRYSVLEAAFRGDLTARWREEHPDAEPACEFLQRIRQGRRKRWEEAELAKYTAKGKTPPKDWKKKYPEPVAVNTEGLPGLPDNWCWVSLDELIISGPSNGYSPPPSLKKNGSKSLKLSATSSGHFVLNDSTIKFLDITIEKGSDLWLRDGDILIQRANTMDLLGTAAIFHGKDFDYIYPDLMSRIRVSRKDLSEFLCAYINSSFGKKYIKSVATGIAGNMPKINGKSLRAFPVPLPGDAEVTIIVPMLNALHKFYLEQLDRYDEVFRRSQKCDQSILVKAFRGELVAQDPTDEPASVLLERIAAEAAVLSTPDAKPQQARRGRKSKPVVTPVMVFPAPGREQRLLRLMEYIISAYPGLSTTVVEERAKLATYPAVCARLLSSRASTFRKALRESGEGWKFSKADVVRFGRLWESLEANYGIRISSEGLCTMREGRKPEPWPSMGTLLPFFNKAYAIFTTERHNHQDIQADLDSIGVMQKIA